MKSENEKSHSENGAAQAVPSQVPVRCDGRDINKCPNPTQCEIEGKCLVESNVSGGDRG